MGEGRRATTLVWFTAKCWGVGRALFYCKGIVGFLSAIIMLSPPSVFLSSLFRLLCPCACSVSLSYGVCVSLCMCMCNPMCMCMQMCVCVLCLHCARCLCFSVSHYTPRFRSAGCFFAPSSQISLTLACEWHIRQSSWTLEGNWCRWAPCKGFFSRPCTTTWRAGHSFAITWLEPWVAEDYF